MITTVTTTTTSIGAASLALIALLTLVTLLIQKEIIGGLEGARAQRLNRALNVAIAPLVVVFLVTVAIKVADILR